MDLEVTPDMPQSEEGDNQKPVDAQPAPMDLEVKPDMPEAETGKAVDPQPTPKKLGMLEEEAETGKAVDSQPAPSDEKPDKLGCEAVSKAWTSSQSLAVG